MGDIRIRGAYVDVAAAALDEGVDERHETRRPDPTGAGQQHDRLSRRVIGLCLRHRSRGLGRGGAGVLGRGRTAGREHRLQIGYERSGEGIGPGGAVTGAGGHRLRRRGGRAGVGGRERREIRKKQGRGNKMFQAKRRSKMEWNGTGRVGAARIVYGFFWTGARFYV